MRTRLVSILLTICMIISLIPTTNVVRADDISQKRRNLIQFQSEKYPDLLTTRSNYSYMMFAEEFRVNVLSRFLMQMTDYLINTGYEPSEQDYMRVIINIILTYDKDNATEIRTQAENDNQKSFKDYVFDIKNAGVDIVTIIAGDSWFDDAVKASVDGLSLITDNTDRLIEALYNLDTVVRDYSAYDDFLQCLEKSDNQPLHSAAYKLRSALKDEFQIRLNMFGSLSEDFSADLTEYFFSDIFIDTLQMTDFYAQNETVAFFVDEAKAFSDAVDVLKASWDLGLLIGKTVGNVVVGGENLIRRTIEILALHDISEVLASSALAEATTALGSSNDSNVDKYIALIKLLIGCRIRGEYCMYSIIASDAGLLSWANKESAEDAKQWYDSQCEVLMRIDKHADAVLITTIESSEDFDDTSVGDDIFNLYGTYRIDIDMTNKHNTETVRTWFGSGIKYGDEMILNEDGSTMWGVGVGYGGEGTYHFEENEGVLDYIPYEEDSTESIPLRIIRESNHQWVTMDIDGYTVYWIQQSGGMNGNNYDGSDDETAINDLRNRIVNEFGESSIADLCISDFDKNGEYEAFVLVGEIDEFGSCFGDLYFITDNNEEMVISEGEFWPYSQNDSLDYSPPANMLHFDDRDFYLIGDYFATGDNTYIFGVKDGRWYEHDFSCQGMALSQVEGTNELTIIQQVYDGFFQFDMGGCVGHTYKPYYLYWNGDFHEYGGIEISVEKLLTLEGAQEYVNLIEQEGYQIDSVYYRANGVININCSYADEYGITYDNMTLRVADGGVEAEIVNPSEDGLSAFSYGGEYSAAFLPERATYPPSFPR